MDALTQVVADLAGVPLPRGRSQPAAAWLNDESSGDAGSAEPADCAPPAHPVWRRWLAACCCGCSSDLAAGVGGGSRACDSSGGPAG